MQFFFVRDFRHRHRFLSTAPAGLVPTRFKSARDVWEKAKDKVIRLNPRDLRQEQAFGLAGNVGDGPIAILHSGLVDERKLKLKLTIFLQRRRTRHIVLLMVELLAVPLSGLLAVLPGPNLAFYVLAVIMIIQWQALRGINKLLHGSHEFTVHPLLAEWERAVSEGDGAWCRALLPKLEETFHIDKAATLFGVKP